jgi:hypothetical protein
MEMEKRSARRGYSYTPLGLIGNCRDLFETGALAGAMQEGIYDEFARGVGGQFE